jgi:hypothetical protein
MLMFIIYIKCPCQSQATIQDWLEGSGYLGCVEIVRRFKARWRRAEKDSKGEKGNVKGQEERERRETRETM